MWLLCIFVCCNLPSTLDIISRTLSASWGLPLFYMDGSISRGSRRQDKIRTEFDFFKPLPLGVPHQLFIYSFFAKGLGRVPFPRRPYRRVDERTWYIFSRVQFNTSPLTHEIHNMIHSNSSLHPQVVGSRRCTRIISNSHDLCTRCHPTVFSRDIFQLNYSVDRPLDRATEIYFIHS